jgi:hypothetical protein
LEGYLASNVLVGFSIPGGEVVAVITSKKTFSLPVLKMNLEWSIPAAH